MLGSSDHGSVVYRAACSQTAGEGAVALHLQSLLWVPARLASAVVRDPELSQHLMDVVLKPGLLPASIQPAEAAQLWGSLYLHCKPQVPILHCYVQ